MTRNDRSSSNLTSGSVITRKLNSVSARNPPQLAPASTWAANPNCRLVEVSAKYALILSSTRWCGFQYAPRRGGSRRPSGMNGLNDGWKPPSVIGELVAVAPANQQRRAAGQVHALEEQCLDQRQREARHLGAMVVQRFGGGAHAKNVRTLNLREIRVAPCRTSANWNVSSSPSSARRKTPNFVPTSARHSISASSPTTWCPSPGERTARRPEAVRGTAARADPERAPGRACLACRLPHRARR